MDISQITISKSTNNMTTSSLDVEISQVLATRTNDLYNFNDLTCIIIARLNKNNLIIDESRQVRRKDGGNIEKEIYILDIVSNESSFAMTIIGFHIDMMVEKKLYGKLLIPVIMHDITHIVLIEINIFPKNNSNKHLSTCDTITIYDSIKEIKTILPFLKVISEKYNLKYEVWKGPFVQIGKHNTYCGGYVARLIECIVCDRKVPWGKGQESQYNNMNVKMKISEVMENVDLMRSEDVDIVNEFNTADAHKFGIEDEDQMGNEQILEVTKVTKPFYLSFKYIADHLAKIRQIIFDKCPLAYNLKNYDNVGFAIAIKNALNQIIYIDIALFEHINNILLWDNKECEWSLRNDIDGVDWLGQCHVKYLQQIKKQDNYIAEHTTDVEIDKNETIPIQSLSEEFPAYIYSSFKIVIDNVIEFKYLAMSLDISGNHEQNALALMQLLKLQLKQDSNILVLLHAKVLFNITKSENNKDEYSWGLYKDFNMLWFSYSIGHYILQHNKNSPIKLIHQSSSSNSTRNNDEIIKDSEELNSQYNKNSPIKLTISSSSSNSTNSNEIIKDNEELNSYVKTPEEERPKKRKRTENDIKKTNLLESDEEDSKTLQILKRSLANARDQMTASIRASPYQVLQYTPNKDKMASGEIGEEDCLNIDDKKRHYRDDQLELIYKIRNKYFLFMNKILIPKPQNISCNLQLVLKNTENVTLCQAYANWDPISQNVSFTDFYYRNFSSKTGHFTDIFIFFAIALCRYEKYKDLYNELGFNIRKNRSISMSWIELASSDMLIASKRDFICREIRRALKKEGLNINQDEFLVFNID